MDAHSQEWSRKCVQCGRSLPDEAMACPTCGHDYRGVLKAVGRMRTPFPEIGGAVVIASGVFQLIIAILMITNFDFIEDADELGVAYAAGGVAVLLASPIVIYGGILAMLRRNLAMTTISAVLTAAIASVVSIYGVMVYGLGLGLVALILIVASKDEFAD